MQAVATLHSADIAFLTVSWITEQLKLEAARRDLEANREDRGLLTWRRQVLMAIAGCLSGAGLLLFRLYT